MWNRGETLTLVQYSSKELLPYSDWKVQEDLVRSSNKVKSTSRVHKLNTAPSHADLGIGTCGKVVLRTSILNSDVLSLIAP